jgi:hypothetical protein
MTRTHAFRCGLRVALALALVTSIAPTASAQTMQRQDVPQVGITVHGRWTIVVRDPDGTEVSRREFENALVPMSGPRLLAQLLGGFATAGSWSIQFNAAGAAQQCYANNAGCSINEAALAFLGGTSNDLTVSVPTSGPNANRLVLRGSARAPRDTAVALVNSVLYTCASSTAADACPGNSGEWFSQKGVSPAIPLVEGQTVDITVVFSFTSPTT